MFNRYLEALRRRWWVALGIFGITMVAVIFFLSQQPVVYETSTTLIMRPRQGLFEDNSDLVRALDTLSRQIEINSTYAKVAQSTMIEERVIEKLGLSSKPKGLAVSATVVPGTNIMEITVKGRNPEDIQLFANSVAAEISSYVHELYGIIDMDLLDAADLPRKPVQPQSSSILMIGTMFALFLGVGAALLVDYVLQPKPKASFDIVDPDTGLFNRPFLNLRLNQEINRSQNNHYPLSVGLLSLVQIKVGGQMLDDSQAPDQFWHDTLINVNRRVQAYLRSEDLLARYDRSTLAIMLPDITGEEAQSIMEEIREVIHAAHIRTSTGHAVVDIFAVAGVAALQSSDTGVEQFLSAAARALAISGKSNFGKVELYTPQMEALLEPTIERSSTLETLEIPAQSSSRRSVTEDELATSSIAPPLVPVTKFVANTGMTEQYVQPTKNRQGAQAEKSPVPAETIPTRTSATTATINQPEWEGEKDLGNSKSSNRTRKARIDDVGITPSYGPSQQEAVVKTVPQKEIPPTAQTNGSSSRRTSAVKGVLLNNSTPSLVRSGGSTPDIPQSKPSVITGSPVKTQENNQIGGVASSTPQDTPISNNNGAKAQHSETSKKGPGPKPRKQPVPSQP